MEDCELLIKNEKALLAYEVRRSPERVRSLLSEEFRKIGASGAYLGFAEGLNKMAVSLSMKRIIRWETAVAG